MKILGTAALMAGAVLLSACGGSSHAVCKDEKSAMEYATKIQGEIQAAVAAGKIDPAKLQSATEAMQKEAAAISADSTDFGKGCELLDNYKKNLGL